MSDSHDVQPIPPGQPAQPVHRTLRRETPLGPCILKRDELRTLFARLSEKGREGLESQIGPLPAPEGTDPEEWKRLKDQAREAANLSALVIGTGGEQVITTEESGLADRHLPDRIRSVVFDSATALKSTLNVDAQNRFVLRIDFSAPPNFNEYNPLSDPTPNNSQIEVSGPDETWVSGVHDLVLQFFKTRSTLRSLLHAPLVFFLLQWLVVFPACIWSAYRLVGALPSSLSEAHPVLTAGLYLYVFYGSFIIFRLLKLAGRRAWPYVELEGDSRRVGRVAFTTLSGGVLVGLLYDLLKTLAW